MTDVESAVADAFRDEYLAGAAPGAGHPTGDINEGVDFLPYYLGKEAVDRRSWDDRPPEMTRARFEACLGAAIMEIDEVG